MSVKRKEFKSINTEIIKADTYQRPIKTSWVNKIVAEWDEMKAHAPKVSYRDGIYWVFDGQHTLMARLIRNQMKPLTVECEVYYGLTMKEEANLFVSLNTDRKKVTPNEELKGRYLAGDKDVFDLVCIIETYGFTAGWTNSKGNNSINALSKALSIMKRDGEDALSWVLDVIRKTWPGDRMATQASILGGVGEIYRTYGNDVVFDKDRLIEKLAKVSAATIIREGHELSVGGDRRYAKRMAFYYNKGVRTNKLDISKLDK